MQGEINHRLDPRMKRLLMGLALAALVALPTAPATAGGGGGSGDESHSRLSDDVFFNTDAVPPRPWRLEFGDPFVGTGNISEGFRLPTGAVWTPSALIWGNQRSAVQAFDGGDPNMFCDEDGVCAEWANRLDIYGNLILSGTERILVGFRPLDRGFTGPNPNSGRFSGYDFTTDQDWEDETASELITLFGEFEIAELFPNVDREDKYPLDIFVSVGRQQLFYQEGILIFDFMDAVGVTKNQLILRGTSNLQITFLYAWNEINRGNNIEVDDTNLYGLFFAVDHPLSTINLDFVYSDDTTSNDFDGAHAGLSFVQRIGGLSTAARVVGSLPTAEEPDRPAGAPTSVVDQGVVFFLEAGFTPHGTLDNVYTTVFYGLDNYTPAARTPGTGGPMGRAGINFAGQGIGRYAASVPNFAQEVVGGAIGWQRPLDGALARRQIIFELGGRQDTDNAETGTLALATRFQQAVGQRFLLTIGGFGRIMENNDEGWGARVEWRTNF